jgi:HTH-type transcriptional regulator/antitoxin HigA
MITSGAKYKGLIDRCALRPLASEEDLDTALEVTKELMERLNSLEEEEKDYLKVLGNLIEEYEALHHALDDEPEGTPAEMLRWLMEVNGLKQVDLCQLLGVTSGRASEIANGVRDMSKNQILILAERFNVTPGMFLSRKPKLLPERTMPKPQISIGKIKPGGKTINTRYGIIMQSAAKKPSKASIARATKPTTIAARTSTARTKAKKA